MSEPTKPPIQPDCIVWDGTGQPSDPHALAVAAWLIANGVEAMDVPADSVIAIRDGNIRYITHARDDRDRLQPAAAKRVAPLVRPWTGAW